VMDVDGGNQTRLTALTARNDDPTWSPSADEISFWSDRDGNWEVYRMGSDGSSQTNLTHNLAKDAGADWRLVKPVSL